MSDGIYCFLSDLVNKGVSGAQDTTVGVAVLRHPLGRVPWLDVGLEQLVDCNKHMIVESASLPFCNEAIRPSKKKLTLLESQAAKLGKSEGYKDTGHHEDAAKDEHDEGAVLGCDFIAEETQQEVYGRKRTISKLSQNECLDQKHSLQNQLDADPREMARARSGEG